MVSPAEAFARRLDPHNIVLDPESYPGDLEAGGTVLSIVVDDCTPVIDAETMASAGLHGCIDACPVDIDHLELYPT